MPVSRFSYMVFAPEDLVKVKGEFLKFESKDPWQQYSSPFKTVEKALEWLGTHGKYLLERFNHKIELFDRKNPTICTCENRVLSLSKKWCKSCGYLLKPRKKHA